MLSSSPTHSTLFTCRTEPASITTTFKVKQSTAMPAPTLLSLATRSCIRNLPGILDVADTPYDLIRTVLKKIQNPQHLHEIEKNSPHIADADAELWRTFIARDIPQWEDKILEPKNPRSWWKVYRKLIREEEQAKEEQEKILEEAMSGVKKAREEHRTQIVGKVIPQQGGARSRAAFVDGQPNPHAGSGWGGAAARTPALQNAKKGKDFIAAMRKQSVLAAKQIGVGGAGKGGFGRESMLLSGRQQIKSAPAWMVRDLRKPVPAAALVARTGSPASRRGGAQVFAPRKGPTVAERAINEAVAQNKAREARLRALTNPGAKGAIAAPLPAPTARPAASAQPAPRAARAVATDGDVSRLNIGAPQNRMSSPAPAQTLVRKRPASTSSPFMPAKKVKR